MTGKKFCLLIAIFASLFFLPAVAAGNNIPGKLTKALSAISNMEIGNVADLKDLGISIDYIEEHYATDPGIYYLSYPRDLDLRATDCKPYCMRFPYLHLNLPLCPENSPTNYAILSDQPETIKDENRYLEKKGSGADGLYGKATAPANKRVRFLADHFNQSEQPKWVKVFMTSAEDTMLYVHKKGGHVADSPIVAGSIADEISHQVNLSDVREIKADTPALLGEWGPVNKDGTAVIWFEMTPKSDVTIWTVVTGDETFNPQSVADLDALPKLRSERWRDNKEKLRTLVNPERFPSRYKRVIDCFIHARGIFRQPDRFCASDYDFKKNPHWIQAYSAFEYIDGIDELTEDGNPVETNNRGNFGGYIRMSIKLKSLPAGTHKIAIITVNTSDSLGGMFKTTINRNEGSSLSFNRASASNEIITQKKAVLLWKGEATEGSTVDIQFFSLANTSVHPWYLLIPMP